MSFRIIVYPKSHKINIVAAAFIKYADDLKVKWIQNIGKLHKEWRKVLGCLCSTKTLRPLRCFLVPCDVTKECVVCVEDIIERLVDV